MNKPQLSQLMRVSPADSKRLLNLCGPQNQHLQQVAERLGVAIKQRGVQFSIEGEARRVQTAEKVLQGLYQATEHDSMLTSDKIHLFIKETETASDAKNVATNTFVVHTKRGAIKARTPNQMKYVQNIQAAPINFGIGPAGTGKTYLAVACAVQALEQELVQRLILVRPAIEAGERLGFLPGDMAQKVDPYLRPLYDALYEMLGFEKVMRLMENHTIEVAPLAFMRGRTLSHAFIILDESQNTTQEQMKMFLTRLGFGSFAVITGDVTQIDLPRPEQSGLRHAEQVLKDVSDIRFSYFDDTDVVRHPVVQSIVRAYQQYEHS